MIKTTAVARLVKDPEVKISGNTKIVNIRIASNRKFKREGQPDADFFDCTAFNGTGEFIEKYFRKGMGIALSGDLQIDSYTNKEGQRVERPRIIISDVDFTEKKSDGGEATQPAANTATKTVSKPTAKAQAPAQAPAADLPDGGDGFLPIPEGVDEMLPFS